MRLDRGAGEDGTGHVLVVVPTFRRPAWAHELVTALAGELATVSGARALILDNDPAGSAAPLLRHPAVAGTADEDRGAGTAHEPLGAGEIADEPLGAGKIAYEHLGAGDVVTVRNAALDRARADGAAYLVLLDDDELPELGWLSALVAAQTSSGADVVAGPVRQEPRIERWPHADALLRRVEREPGPFTGDVGAGNVLLSMGLVDRAGLRFDPRLGASGGEDTLFFRQAVLAGARLWWAPEATVVERAVPGRFTRRAVVRRSLANGRSSVLVDEALDRRTSRLRRSLVLAGAAAVHGPAAVVELARGRRRQAWRRVHKIVRHVGRVAGPGTRGDYGGDSGARTFAPEEERST